MQINLQDSGTYLFISDHCHVIENVSWFKFTILGPKADTRSGVMVFHRDGSQEITRRGSDRLND